MKKVFSNIFFLNIFKDGKGVPLKQGSEHKKAAPVRYNSDEETGEGEDRPNDASENDAENEGEGTQEEEEEEMSN